MSSRDERAPADQAARNRIVTEFDRNLLVEAGAGSGKTQKLAERMAAGVATGAYELERMAAVTFTRKAAAELRGRFQLALEAQLTDGPASERSETSRASGGGAPRAPINDDHRQRIRAALSNLERFFAGTIHSFCARLLRERPVEAGVSPGFTELDDVEERLLQQQSWRDYRAQAKAVGDADLLELLDAGITAKQLDKAFEIVCTYEDVTFPPGDAPMPDMSTAWKALEEFNRSLQTLLPAQRQPDSKCKTQERAGRFERQWRAYLRGNRDAALLADLLRCWESKPDITQKWWTPKTHSKLAEQLHADFRSNTVLPYLTAWRQYLYRRCVSLLSKARASANAERRRRNSLSFNDLLILTAAVLRTNAEVRGALQQKYRWLFVDEFQDTDPVQAEIMFLLAADNRRTSLDLDWRTVALRPGALFVVGDPKQSIYRFRRADIDIYNEVRARLAGPDGSGLVRLTTNFRSVPDLCAWANDVFKDRFPAAPTSQSPMFAPLDPYRAPSTSARPERSREASREQPRGVLATLDLHATIDAGDVSKEEASRIARYIRAEVDAGRREYEDFLILTRKKKGLRPYAEALESLRIPIEVAGAGAFGESAEVREIALLLTALADPQDAVALVGVLRGTLFGLSDRDLFAFRQAGGYFNLCAEIQPIDQASARVSAALLSLRQWFTWTRRLPAGAALERILEDSGYLALAATSHGGVEAGDLLHAIDRIRACVENGFTLADAANALATWSGLDDDPEESTEVDSLPLEPGRRDVVRLMNLHKAKGLEAKVVFLADPLGGFDPRVDVRIVREGPTPQGFFQIVAESENFFRRIIAEPADWAAHEAAEKAYLTAEVDRLLYVAATRAKDMLVVGRYLGGSGRRTPAWDAFSAKLAGVPSLPMPPAVAPVVASDLTLAFDAAATAVGNANAAHTRARESSWSSSSVTAEAKRLPRIVVEPADALDAADPTRAIVPDTASHRADAGMAWGTLVHGLLEHAMRHPAATREDLRRLAMWLTMEEPRLRGAIEQALDTVESVANASFWQEARASAERHEEAPFAILHADAAVPRVVTGVIDLVHRTPEGWRAIDYKTDVDLDNADAKRRYEDQLRDYATAWSRVAGRPVTTSVVAARKGSAG